MKTAIRILASIAGFCVITISSFLAGLAMFAWAASSFPPEGIGDTDPRGRAVAITHPDVGIFVCVLLGAVGAWLVWLATERKNWSFDLAVAAPLFLISAPIASGNYITMDTIFTRDAQAILNILLVASGSAIVVMLHRNVKYLRSTFVIVAASTLLAICLYAFVAIPLWYSLSYLSWTQGAGELTSLDDAAKAVGAAGSLVAVVGLLWKDGQLDVRKARSRPKRSTIDS